MNINEDDTNRIFNDGGDEDSNVLTQDNKKIYIYIYM